MPKVINNTLPPIPDNSDSGKIFVPADRPRENSFFKSTLRASARAICSDILIPTAKNMIYESISGMLYRLLNGTEPQNAPYSGMRTIDGRQYTDYSSLSRNAFNTKSIATDRYRTSVYDYQDIRWRKWEDAELALSTLIDRFEENCNNSRNHPYVTVLDLKEIAKWSPISSVDENWGWYDLSPRNTKVRSGLDGYYYLSLPPITGIR